MKIENRYLISLFRNLFYYSDKPPPPSPPEKKKEYCLQQFCSAFNSLTQLIIACEKLQISSLLGFWCYS